MFKKILALAAACFAIHAHAAVVNPIVGLDIGGVLYDVTFHDTPGDSFNALWDANDDGVFGGGGSEFSSAPTFWGDEAGAQAAAIAIIDFLGAVDTTTVTSDSFIVPCGGTTSDVVSTDCVAFINAGTAFVSGFSDGNPAPISDAVFGPYQAAFDFIDVSGGGRPYVSFAATVPVPAAGYLFITALVGLFTRKQLSGK